MSRSMIAYNNGLKQQMQCWPARNSENHKQQEESEPNQSSIEEQYRHSNLQVHALAGHVALFGADVFGITKVHSLYSLMLRPGSSGSKIQRPRLGFEFSRGTG